LGSGVAHRDVQPFDEEDSFKQSIEGDRNHSLHALTDTFNDSVRGTHRACNAVDNKRGLYPNATLEGVRIDTDSVLKNGNIINDQSFENVVPKVHHVLNERGYNNAILVISSDIDEYRLLDLGENGILENVDVAGIGTMAAIPPGGVGMVYKITQLGNTPTLKTALNKLTLPGTFELFRGYDKNDEMCGDVIGCLGEKDNIVFELLPDAVEVENLLYDFMINGEIVSKFDDLEAIQNRGKQQWDALPDKYKVLREAPEYPVLLSPKLRNLQQELVELVNRGRTK
jgi:nicotinate phosphoribosyltransferase